MEPEQQDPLIAHISEAKDRLSTMEAMIERFIDKKLIILYSLKGAGKSIFANKLIDQDSIYECPETEKVLSSQNTFSVNTGAVGLN